MQCDVSVKNLRGEGASSSPPWQLCRVISFRTRSSKATHSKLNVLHELEATLYVPANQIGVKAIMTYLLQFECSLSVERVLKNNAVLFVALFSEMLALKTEHHLASPLGPRQTYAARCPRNYAKIKFGTKVANSTKVNSVLVLCCGLLHI
jgi:hypothetical protein